MCLITNLKKPFIAKNDIVVYKKLRKSYNDECEYLTPFQNTPVTLNAMLSADSKKGYIKGTSEKLTIEGGFIHAYLSLTNGFDYELVFKAIIPKGTEFYISDDFKEICARQLFITDEIISVSDIPSIEERVNELYSDYFINLYEEQEIEGKKVAIGYLCLEDKSFIRPDVEHEGKEVIGIVGNIKDGVITVVSLDEECLPWSNKFENVDTFSSDGKANTKVIRGFTERKDGDYPLFDWVDNYVTKGTDKGDWYIGSYAEVHDVVYISQMMINVGFIISSVGVQLGASNGFWSSSEYSSGNARLVRSSFGTVYGNGKDTTYRSRAFLRL